MSFDLYARLGAYQFFYFAFVGVFSPYFGLYLDAIGWSGAAIAALMAVMQAMRVLAPLLWSHWAEGQRERALRLVQAAPWLAAAGFAVFYLSEAVAPALLAIALVAFFWSGALPLFEAMTLAHLGTEARRYPWVRLWGSVGFIAAVLGVGAWLEDAPLASVRHWIVATLVALGFVALSLPPAPLPPRHDIQGLQRRWRWWRERPIAWFFLATFWMSVAHGALYTFYSLHLSAHDYGKSTIGTLWALGVIAEIGVFLWLPRLLRQHSPWPWFVASFAVAALRFALIASAIESPAVAVLAQLMHAVTFGVYHGTAVAILNAWFGARAPALGQAVYSSVSFGLGGMVGAAIAGVLWTWGAGQTAFAGAAVFAAIGGVAALSAAKVKERSC